MSGGRNDYRNAVCTRKQQLPNLVLFLREGDMVSRYFVLERKDQMGDFDPQRLSSGQERILPDVTPVDP